MAADPDKDVKAAASIRFQKSYFDVLGLCCSSEVPLIETILKSIDGVKEYSVIVPTRTLVVVHDGLLISQLQIVKALNQAGLEASVRAYGNANYQKKWPSPYAVACCLLLLVSLFKYFYHPLVWVALGAVAIGIIPILLKALASLRNLRPDTNLLVLIAVMGTIAMNDYIEAGTIVFLFTIAEWLESRASHKATAVMESLMNIAPQKAVIAETGEQVDAKEVELNTVLAVKTGDVVPIDGIVVDGECEVDEKALTGESFPVYKQKDSNVLAGTINLNGYISVKTTALAGDCVVAKMAKLVEEAQNNKSRTQRFIDKFAQYYTPAVVIISASFAVVPLTLPKEAHRHKHWFHLALVVLVSACPCALVLSTPVATFCALTKAALSGLVIKGGGHLETLAKIKTIAFDKTGTITRGEFIVKDFKSVSDDVSLDVLLYWVSSIESKSSHPMAAALVDYGRSLSIESKPENVRDFRNFPGEGVHGRIDGKDIYIGNKKIARRAGSQTVPFLDGDTDSGRSIGYVYCGATPAGIFYLSDACRTGVIEAIKELKSMAIKTVMLTGDSQAAALHAQEELGNAFDEIHAELLPEDKARYIEVFKEKGPTAMVGDGINDAPALASADIGISMGISGSDLATETGQVILMSNDIRKVPKVIQLARYSYRKVIENVIISISAKSAVLALAFFGHPLVWAAVLADVGTCLLVIFNSMLLLRGTNNPEGKCYKSSAAAHGCHSAAEPSQNHTHSCSNSMIDKGWLHWFTSCTQRCQYKDPGMKACGNNMCTDASNGKVEFVGAIEINNHEETHHDHDTCNIVTYDIMAKVSHNHGCQERQGLCSKKRKKVASSVEVGAVCMTGNDPNESKCCHLKCCETVNSHGITNRSIHSAKLEEGQKRSNKALSHPSFSNNDHHDNMQINESSGKIVQSSCNQKAESYHDLKICCDEQVHTAFDASNGQESDETTMEACMNLDKRGVVCSCKSYVKEYCCSKQGRYAGIASGLTEIVTE